MDTRFYRALIVQDDGEGSDDGYGVVFPDLPGCTSLGETVEQAYEHAFEALALHIEGMVEEGIPLPQPSPFTAPLPDWLAAAGGGPSSGPCWCRSSRRAEPSESALRWTRVSWTGWTTWPPRRVTLDQAISPRR